MNSIFQKVSISIIPFFILLAFNAAAKGKVSRPYFIHPLPIQFDSISIENILSQENVKYISNSLILIAEASMVDNTGARLYYKINATTWYGFDLTYNSITIDTVNLDRRGKPELILQCYGYAYGSGGGFGIGAFMVINIDSFPIELMNVANFCSEEKFGRSYNGLVNFSLDFERKIFCRNGSITVNRNNLRKLNSIKRKAGNNCELNQIPSGDYRMIGGRLTLQTK